MAERTGDIWSKSQRREIVAATEDEHGDETHPAFGMIKAHRVSHSPPGAVMFDSDMRHQHYMTIAITRATRKRDLNHDWIHGREELIEVQMSEAQWAAFVSSVNTSGVPCTLTRIDRQPVDGLEFKPRLEESMRETREAAHRAFDEIQEALAEYEAHKTKRNLDALRAKIRNAVPNVDYAGKTLGEHAENVVTKARADIEAMVARSAHELGIEAPTQPLQIEQGDEEVVDV